MPKPPRLLVQVVLGFLLRVEGRAVKLEVIMEHAKVVRPVLALRLALGLDACSGCARSRLERRQTLALPLGILVLLPLLELLAIFLVMTIFITPIAFAFAAFASFSFAFEAFAALLALAFADPVHGGLALRRVVLPLFPLLLGIVVMGHRVEIHWCGSSACPWLIQPKFICPDDELLRELGDVLLGI